MPAERFFFRPLIHKGSGSGHLRRCFDTAVSLVGRSAIFLDILDLAEKPMEEWAEEIPGFPGDIPIYSSSEVLMYGISDDLTAISGPARPGFFKNLIIFDNKVSRFDHVAMWMAFATPVLLDDDGPARKIAPFVIDSIPGPRNSEANISSPSWLRLPGRCRNPDPKGSILVSFGGHDPAGLTFPIAEALIMRAGVDPGRITVTLAPELNADRLPPGVRILDAPINLREYLGDFGMVFCSFGLTAWEAIAAGCAVITAEPTRYHARLSRKLGFPGIGNIGYLFQSSLPTYQEMRLVKLMKSPDTIVRAANRLTAELDSEGRGNSLAALYESLEAPIPHCSACGCFLQPVIARFPRRSYYRCKTCGMTGLYRFELKDDEYGSAYFQEEYQDQYGRSYLEDFQSIKTMAGPRLDTISRRAESGGSLLDIGCAFGPFLEAAGEAGFRPYGIDVSVEGTDYVRNVLGIPAVSGSFPDDNPAAAFNLEVFDVVSLWYVIEHFTHLRSVLEALNGLLPKGGVLALSTPNGSGISGRRSYRRFLENSPHDHYTVWNPRVARRLLTRYGFRVYKIRVTGHHPERFGFTARTGGILFAAIDLASRLFGLGDTFEVYAVKEASLG